MDTKARDWTNDEITLGEFLYVIRRAKWSIAAFALSFAVIAYATAHFLPKKYEASIVVSPVSTNESSPQSGGFGAALVSQFSGLAEMAGISLTNDQKKAETLAVLKSQALTERYIQDNHLLPVLYPKLWDPVHGTWKTTDSQKTPTLWKANEYFKGHVRTITIDAKTGLVTLAITWTDPRLAAQWANGLVRMTNDYLRAKAIDESERNIAYLTGEASKTDVVGVKQAIYTLLENQFDKVMIARGNDEYAIRVLDPAQPPERPSSPKPLIWALIGLGFGVLVALGTALLRTNSPAKQLERPLVSARLESAET
jgi:uncharacterized protein involved in exopolysaccharide biosynthesis